MQIYGNLPYKCSIQKKRQIQLFVRDIMNSICPTNFFRTTDTTDTTDNTIWKPGFNLNCLVFPPRHLYLIQNVLWKVKRLRRNQNWIDMGKITDREDSTNEDINHFYGGFAFSVARHALKFRFNRISLRKRILCFLLWLLFWNVPYRLVQPNISVKWQSVS